MTQREGKQRRQRAKTQRLRGEHFSLTDMVRALDPMGGLRWRDRFQVRLVASLVLLSLATSATAGLVYYRRQVGFVEAEQRKRGRTLISNLAGQSELGAYARDRAFLAVPARRALWEEDVNYVAIYGRSGKPLIRLAKQGVVFDARLSKTELERLLADASPRTLTRSHPDHDDLLAPIVSLDMDAEQGMFGRTGAHGSATVGIARLGLSRQPAQRKLREVLRWGIYLALIILAMGVLMGLFLARRISRPILALARGADEMRQGKLGVQIDVERSDELGLLSLSFNRMSANLKRTVESLAHLNRTLEQEVGRRTGALRSSRDFILLLNAPLRPQELLDIAVDALAQLTGAAAVVAYVIGPKRRLELAVCHGTDARAFGEPEEDSALIQLAPGVPLAPRAELAPELIRRLGQQERVGVIEPVPASLPLARSMPAARALLCAPLRYRERLEGVVVLVLDTSPTPDQVEFIDNAGSQLAIAISNARAYAEADRLARDLEQRNVVLLQQRDELQEVSRLKSEFLASVSHELRTPLNAVIGYTELLGDEVYGPISKLQAQSLAGIDESATNLLHLINDILDLSKVEAGKMTVSYSRVDLNQMAREVVAFSAPLVRDRPYDIAVSLPARALVVETDAGKVRQILVNLLSNAIKFTDDGTVEVQVGPTADGGARVRVIDTGVGMLAEDLRVIFDEFRQLDGSSTRRHGGTGLGLAISRKFAHLIGASLQVRSIQGEGSTFTLLVPGPAQLDRTKRQTQPGYPAIGESNHVSS